MVATQSVRMPDGTPQYVVWAERWLAGASMLVAESVIDDALKIVSPEDFGTLRLAAVWRAVQTVRARHDDPSLPVVAMALLEAGELDRIGGEPFLADIASEELTFCYAHPDAMEAHATLIHEWGERRRTADMGREMVKEAYSGKPLTGKVIHAARRFRGGVSFDVK